MEPFIKVEQERQPTLLYIQSWMNRYPGLSAGFTSRLGGMSVGDYQSLNCGLHVGDDASRVMMNRNRIAQALDVPFEAWTCAEQVHGNHIHVVTEADKGKGRDSRETAIADTDGLVTNASGIWLTTYYADCVPLYFYDPIHQAVGIAHAGWKGTALAIAAQTVETMQREYGSEPQHLLAAIGPSIGQCCYEVDHKVVQSIQPLFDGNTVEKDCDIWYTERTDGKYMLDLQQINRQIMIKAGILTSHIELSMLCTSCNTGLFFSHRKEEGKTGRMMAWIGLNLHAR